MRMPTTVWAAEMVGQRWTPEFNCWGLVRQYMADQHGIHMPDMSGAIDDAGLDAVSAIKRVALDSAWRHVDDAEPRQDDIVLMRTPSGRRHIGIVIRGGGQLMVLHNNGEIDKVRGPIGHVEAEYLADLRAAGYRDFALWRRASC